MGGYRRHELFKRPRRRALLWRYIDFAKFVDLLDRGALFFSRADRLGDPWEGEIGTLMEDRQIDELLRFLSAGGTYAIPGPSVYQSYLVTMSAKSGRCSISTRTTRPTTAFICP